MAELGPDELLRSKLEAATVVVPADTGLPVARFALIIKSGEDLLSVVAAVKQATEPLVTQVDRLSNLDHRALVLSMPGRCLRRDPAPAFEAAYELVRRFDLEAAEPDIHTDIVPEPDKRRRGAPNESIDDFPPGCWAPEQPALKPHWAIENMSVPQAWGVSDALKRPSRGVNVIVAQPDTGITAHPELQGVVHVQGYDFVDDDSDPTDPLDYVGNPGHGTGTASVVVSRGTGHVAGSAPNASHMSVRAVESVVRLSQVTVAQAIDYALEKGAHVISMSLGGIPSFSLDRAVTRAVSSDVIVLAAAGNCVGFVVWPARLDACVAVAGTNDGDKPWRGSSNGPDVDISAPAENVFRASAEKGKPPGVGQGQGTSFAVALTSGVAACWLAHHGRANLIAAARARGETLQAMFLRLLKATARRPKEWDSFNMGAGIVHAERLLRADFNLGRDREAVVSAPSIDAAALSVRRLVAEAVSADAAQADIDWKLHGPEIALSILNLKRGKVPDTRGGPRPETTLGAFEPEISPTLARAIATAPALEAVLASRNPAGE